MSKPPRISFAQARFISDIIREMFDRYEEGENDFDYEQFVDKTLTALEKHIYPIDFHPVRFGVRCARCEIPQMDEDDDESFNKMKHVRYRGYRALLCERCAKGRREI